MTSAPPSKIVVFCPNLIGDTVMATPALRALRRGFPGATIVGVIKPHVAATLDGLPFFDRLIRFDPKARDRRFRTASPMRRPARRTPRSAPSCSRTRSARPSWPGSRGRGEGWATPEAGAMCSLPIGSSSLATATASACRTRSSNTTSTSPRGSGCPLDSLRTELYTTAADEAAADRAWEHLELPRHEPTVCLNTGGAFGPAKNWPIEHFATLARRLADEQGLSVLVICGPGERENARAIVARAGHPRVVSLADQPLGIGLTKACVRRSALLITTDSGPRHFAAPFDVPVLTLFGPTHIAWTRTYHPHAAPPVPAGSVRSLPEAGLPARPPPLHARAVARRGLSGRAAACCRGREEADANAGLARHRRKRLPRPAICWRPWRRPNRDSKLVASGRRRSPDSSGRPFAGGPRRSLRASARDRDDPALGRHPHRRPDAPGRRRRTSIVPTRWRRSTCSTRSATAAAPRGSCWPARRRSSGRSSRNTCRSGKIIPAVRARPTA